MEEFTPKDSHSKRHYVKEADEKKTVDRSNLYSELEQEELLKLVDKSIIGQYEPFFSPFGIRKTIYCDYTASGRSLSFIEDYIRDQVLTLYANTHTSTSVTGYQTSLFYREAKLYIKSAINANFSKGNKKDCLFFLGSGSTAAINAIVSMTGVNKFSGIDKDRAIIFVGPYEHHSNLLPWKEAGALVITIPFDENGEISVTELKNKLIEYSNFKLRIGSFSAASNVTGKLTDTEGISALLHEHGALAFWDYASAAPYVTIDMNPIKEGTHKDALFISAHKFIGGVDCPGILVVKKKVITNDTPFNPGGGTIFFVSPYDYIYEKNKELRQVGGTPPIVGAIRAGLIFQLKDAMGIELIEKKEASFYQRAIQRLRKNKNIIILGQDYNQPFVEKQGLHNLPIFSFVIVHSSGRMLHHNFVCAVLNDLFGIQLRGGCMCAGPFAHYLLGIDKETSKKIETALLQFDENEVLRPGFTRFNFNSFMSEEIFNYVLDAVEFVAQEGWKLMPFYFFHPDTAEWLHQKNKVLRGKRWIGSVNYKEGKMSYTPRDERLIKAKEQPLDLNYYLNEAKKIVEEAVENYKSEKLTVPEVNFDDNSLRWFVLPHEVYYQLLGGLENQVTDSLLTKTPFIPKQSFITKKNEQNTENEDLKSSSNSTSELVCGISKIILPNKKDIKLHTIPKSISKPFSRALIEFDMLKPNDKLLVCVSGGKDSLTLLHAMKHLQTYLPFKFEVAAATVDPQTSSYDPSPLKEYMKLLGIPYFYEKQPLIELAKEKNAKSICSWCARMKRGILYNIARREGYNVLAMGQHLDDLSESFLMSAFNNGSLRTMKVKIIAANYVIDAGDLRVIRPFVYVRERQLKHFALTRNLPVISENCPACFEIPKERARLKNLLSTQEMILPKLFHSLSGAMKPLISRGKVTESVETLKDEIETLKKQLADKEKNLLFLQTQKENTIVEKNTNQSIQIPENQNTVSNRNNETEQKSESKNKESKEILELKEEN